MEPILLLAHTEPDGTLAKPALEALAAALALGGELTVGLVGGTVAAAANQIPGCGAARFLGVAGEPFTQPRYATAAAAAEAPSADAPSAAGLIGVTLPSAANPIAACGAVRFRGVAAGPSTQPRYVTAAAAAEALSADAPSAAGLIDVNLPSVANPIAACGAVRFRGVAGGPSTQPRYATAPAAPNQIGRSLGRHKR